VKSIQVDPASTGRKALRFCPSRFLRLPDGNRRDSAARECTLRPSGFRQGQVKEMAASAQCRPPLEDARSPASATTAMSENPRFFTRQLADPSRPKPRKISLAIEDADFPFARNTASSSFARITSAIPPPVGQTHTRRQGLKVRGASSSAAAAQGARGPAKSSNSHRAAATADNSPHALR